MIYGEDSLLLIYLSSDGTLLRPTQQPWGTLLGGKVVSLSLKEGQGGREWLEKAAAADLASIRLVDLPDELDTAVLAGAQAARGSKPERRPERRIDRRPSSRCFRCSNRGCSPWTTALRNDARAVLANQPGWRRW